MRSSITTGLGLVLTLAVAGCHSGPHRDHGEHAVVVVEAKAPAAPAGDRERSDGGEAEKPDPVVVRRSVPGAGVLTHPAARDPGPPDQIVRIEAKVGGWKVPALLELVSEKTGFVIVYDPKAQQVNTAKAEWIGTVEVPANRLFAWMQDLLYPHKLALIPNGPLGAEGRQWFVVDTANPILQARPLFVHWDEVDALAERDGLLIMTVFPLADGADSARLRSALSQFSTRTAAIGRVVDIKSPPSLMVMDFAPMVAQMRRVVLQMGLEYRGPASDD